MRIGELAARAGVSVRALRYYEEHNLLAADRSQSGQRHYPESAVDRVQLIQRLYASGLSSKMILKMLPCIDAPGDAGTEQSIAFLLGGRERINAQIADLIRTRDTLDAVIRDARTCTVHAGHPETHTGALSEESGRSAPGSGRSLPG
ncbi:MerR family transcriptional regulator [Streptosporangium sp. 'caverna']|uniref:MerR family transcriptional regulator n=1 Tax=Streptosporangium sp. 'caverna' TaxID=2202249 RepID=UPI000D7E02D5|nr:MerR family transcriptional regulator [Streptosporangium sp. 'caverna']AWS44532.1 MerR family transcriptional regulator [Streptosporangium sp. 'caverna']